MEDEHPESDDISGWREAADYIRNESIAGRLADINCLKDIMNIADEDIPALIERMAADTELIVLKRISDENGTVYLYSGNDMSDRYAHILTSLKQKDLLEIIADVVRYESKTYPRPTCVNLFLEKPYSVEYETLKDLLDNLGAESQYHDLQFIRASNDIPFLYSDRYLTEFYATKLAEWNAVQQYESP